ncbi:MAG: MarR family transcriptional regulator [Desulfobacterales bacterium]|nr:MarR family transcriptional regulator [Desulfobacterales bacterium]
MTKENQLTFNRFVSMISRCGQIYFDRELAHLNIGSGQIRILRALDLSDGVNQEHIRLIFHLDKGTVAKSIKPLIREGYIRREKNLDDKRAYRIFLTDKGREIMPMLKQTVQNWAEVLTSGFTTREKEAANDLLSRMSQNARDHISSRTSNRPGESSK